MCVCVRLCQCWPELWEGLHHAAHLDAARLERRLSGEGEREEEGETGSGGGVRSQVAMDDVLDVCGKAGERKELEAVGGTAGGRAGGNQKAVAGSAGDTVAQVCDHVYELAIETWA